MTRESRDSLGRALLWTVVVFAASALARAAEETMLPLLLRNAEAADHVVWRSRISFAWPLAIIASPWMGAVQVRRRLVLVLAAVSTLALATASVACLAGGHLLAVIAAFGMAELVGRGIEIMGWGMILERCAERRHPGLYLSTNVSVGVVSALVTGVLVSMTGTPGRGDWSASWGVALGILTLCAGGAMVAVRVALPADEPRRRADGVGRAYAGCVRELFSTPSLRGTLLVFAGWSMAQAVADSMLPLAMLTPVEDGGLGLTNATLGVLRGVSRPVGGGIGMLVACLVVYRSGVRRVVTPILVTGLAGLGALVPLFQLESSTGMLSAALWFHAATVGAATTATTLLVMHAAASSSYPLAHFALIWGGAGLLATSVGRMLSPLAGTTGWPIVASIVAAAAVAAMWLVPRATPPVNPHPQAG